MRLGYAIEYDCIDPTVLDASLQRARRASLYLAGQVNGTSGYESRRAALRASTPRSIAAGKSP